jgi:hypothetical protein
MLGQACLVVDPGFGGLDGAGLDVEGAVALWVVVVEGAAVLVVVVVVVVLLSAAAPEIPAAAPPVARAPATIVAPSILEIRIGFDLPLVDMTCTVTMGARPENGLRLDKRSPRSSREPGRSCDAPASTCPD